MAKAKKKTGKGRAAKRPAARKSRKTAAAKRPARSAGAGASAKRIAQLEAENRQLRDELAALRAEQAAAGEPGAEGEDRPPAADF